MLAPSFFVFFLAFTVLTLMYVAARTFINSQWIPRASAIFLLLGVVFTCFTAFLSVVELFLMGLKI